MKKPLLSVVIPYHNSRETIGRLLRSLSLSKRSPLFEVIIVDDGSVDTFRISEYKNQSTVVSGTKTTSYPIRNLTLSTNAGPAAARNKGAKIARGKCIVFLDSDVEVFPDTLENIANIYKEDPDVVALTGVWVKEQRTSSFFPNFKALRDWSYWINERDKSGYYFLFSTRIASIKKTVFLRLGGFDESYDAALVEDIELTYRIARRYAIIFASNVRVKHEFENFWPIAKKYFLRAYYWTKLYAKRKKFDPVATTIQEAITTLSGVAVVLCGLLAAASLPGLPLIVSVGKQAPFFVFQLAMLNYQLFFIACALHLFLVRKFLVFLIQEKGAMFALKGFIVGLILYCFIFSGVVWGNIRMKFEK